MFWNVLIHQLSNWTEIYLIMKFFNNYIQNLLLSEQKRGPNGRRGVSQMGKEEPPDRAMRKGCQSYSVRIRAGPLFAYLWSPTKPVCWASCTGAYRKVVPAFILNPVRTPSLLTCGAPVLSFGTTQHPFEVPLLAFGVLILSFGATLFAVLKKPKEQQKN